ncbi:MAG: TonB-dependent receptor plug domain-containing protein [Gammaproteobacteria bacterium]|nr:TonB-dependent receptor plug domain-containing protein [Gammaproteobacteria bacterium]
MAAAVTSRFLKASILYLAITSSVEATAQLRNEAIIGGSTIVYDAKFFAEFSPVNVNDMMDRIPGISLAMNNRGGGNRRGLGAGENEILINGQRQTGKSNEGRDQLSRLSADQVDYIEIIRGTSEEMDIRSGGQVVNIVLLDSRSRSNITAEANMDRYHDGTFDPGAKLSWTGQSGSLNYLFHLEGEPRYQNRLSKEFSRDPAGNLLETRFEDSTREQTDYETSFNLGYQFDSSLVQLNGLYGGDCAPEDKERLINDYSDSGIVSQLEREDIDRCRENWEIGGDYEYEFRNGGKYRFLFIVNDGQWLQERDRFEVFDDREEKDLFLYNNGRDQERIFRTSYTFDPIPNHGLEFGIERAQTLRDGNLRLGLDLGGTPSPEHGFLTAVAVDNSNSTVEEVRYENFLVHNWQINDKSSLESSLIYETSTITQTGDVYNERDFDFVRPKLDYRYNINQSMQLRATAEKLVSQLSFSDFMASSDSDDDDQNTQAGNPEIAQEQHWEYSLNLEYRLPNSIGVLNSEIYYRDYEDVIDRVDVSTGPDDLRSARGNIGDAYRYGINLDASSRLGYIGLPSALLSLGMSVQDSEVTDPFLNVKRRMRYNSRWFGRASFRHDITRWDMSYGFSYFNSDNDSNARQQIDINDIERDIRDYGLMLFFEKKAFNGITFRLDVRNANDPLRCRERTRFLGATIGGIVEEIENYCSQDGPVYALKVRHTF